MNRLCHFVAVIVSCWAVFFAAPVAIAQQQDSRLSSLEMKEAKELNLTYAKYLNTTACVQRKKASKRPGNETPEQLKLLSARYEKSCSCLTDEVLSKYSSDALLKSLVELYGTHEMVSPKQGVAAQQPKPPSQTSLKILNMEFSRDIKSKCGL